MKRDFLKELGLEDEVIDKVMAEHISAIVKHISKGEGKRFIASVAIRRQAVH